MGTRTHCPLGTTWIVYQSGGGMACSDQALLRLDPPCWGKSLRIEENSVNSQGWTFKLGDTMIMSVTRHGMTRSPGVRYISCNDPCLYEWDELYLGMNRVVDGPYRSGSGLCQVCLTWEDPGLCC